MIRNDTRMRWLARGAAFALLATLGAQEDGPRVATATLRDALRGAEELAERVRGLEGAERQTALEQAAKQYEEVGTRHADAGPGAAEAWWEAGELWRRHGSMALAEKAYRRTLELDANRYGERALLELGHVLRRQDRAADAIDCYTKATAVKPASARAHEARLWIGRTHAQQGKLAEAIAAYRGALEATDQAGRIVEACDMLGMAQVKSGDLAGAGESLRLAESQLGKVQGPAADRLKKSIDGMSLKRSLQRVQDKQARAAADAEKLERDGRK
jgi:tetratricopeptide (TPR) repeat protein